ncbi:ChaN family lipoprotein [Vibrio astriarenae]|uniref:ChaN family lipoprotein n=1 Tax=Vibrio astriarenae TaxID=1481923 RepID=UPI003736F88E
MHRRTTTHSAATLTITLLLASCIQSSQAPAQIPSIAHYYDYQTIQNSRALDIESLSEKLQTADVILVGEWHTHSAVHRFQTELYHHLIQSNEEVTLSMEQFTRDKQRLVDAYLNGTIGEQFLKKKANAWPNYESDYRALVELAKLNQQSIVAANAPRKIVHCVGQRGLEYLEELPTDERKWVATNIDLSDNPYKQQFLASMHHGDPSMNEQQYAAQATWDETMAESIVNHLENNPTSKVMHIAGDFHINKGLGIKRVINRLNPDLSVVTISPSSEVESGSDFTLQVLPPPQRYVQEKHRMEAYHSFGHGITPASCD